MSDKTIRLLVDLTYDAEMAHGDKEDAIAWFNDILMSEDLQLCSFSEFGDTIGKIKVVDQQEAARIEELEAKLAKAMQVIEMIASADVDAVLGEAVDISCEIIGELMEEEEGE